MRNVILPILMLVLLIGPFHPTPTHAQDNATLWFWATTPEGLVAYTLDGQVNHLLDDPTLIEKVSRGIRLSADTALIYDNETEIVYVVGPQSVATTAPLDDEVFDAIRIHAYRHPYVVFTGALAFAAAGVLNVDTMEISQLSGYVPTHAPRIVFVNDTTLRYYSVADSAPGQDTPSALWERDLTTGEDTALLNFDFYSFGAFHNKDGQQWWVVGLYNAATGMADGVTTFGTVNPDLTAALQTLTTRIDSDWVLTLDTYCETDCAFSITPLAGGETRTVILPTNRLGQVPTIRGQLPDGTLLLFHPAADTVYRIDATGNLLELGVIDPFLLTPLVPSSNDGRLAVVLGDAGDSDEDTFTYRLWDLAKGEILHEAPAEVFVSAIFSADSALMLNRANFELYFAGTVYTLSAYAGYFYQPLGNGQVLYEPARDVELTPGIYMYDALADTLTLLVAEGRGIRLEELPPSN